MRGASEPFYLLIGIEKYEKTYTEFRMALLVGTTYGVGDCVPNADPR